MDAYKTANRYQETAINTATPVKLVVLLYQGAIRFMQKAVSDIESKNLEGKRDSVGHALAIIQELHATLNLERGGEIAAELDRLYDFVTARILEASTRLDARPLKEALHVMTDLVGAWEQIAEQGAGDSVRNMKGVRA